MNDTNTQRSVTLIFPPYCENSLRGPYLAPALLAGYLTKFGINANWIDLNKAFFSHMREKFSDTSKNCFPNSGKGKGKDFFALENLENFETKKIIKKEFLFQTHRTLGLDCHHTYARILADFFELNSARLKRALFDEPQRIAEDKCLNPYIFLMEPLISSLMIPSPSVVCITVAFGQQLIPAITIARLISLFKKDIQVILGGPQITLLTDGLFHKIKNLDFIDGMVRGEGEEIIKNFALFSTSNPSIENKSSKCKTLEGNVLMDRLPNPQWPELFDGYSSNLDIPVMVARGCAYGGCSFCDYTKLSPYIGKKRKIRNPNIITREIQLMREKFHPSRISLIADGLSHQDLSELASALGQNEDKRDLWSFMMMDPKLDLGLFRRFHQAGLANVSFGLEFVGKRIRRLMSKPLLDKDCLYRILANAREAGIDVSANIIPDFPGVELSDIEECLNFIDSHDELFNHLSIQRFALSAHSRIAKNPNYFGINVLKEHDIYNSQGGLHFLKFHRLNGLKGDTLEKMINEFEERALSIAFKNEATINFELSTLTDSQLEDLTLSVAPDLVTIKNQSELILYQGGREKIVRINENWSIPGIQKCVKQRKIRGIDMAQAIVNKGSLNINQAKKISVGLIKALTAQQMVSEISLKSNHPVNH